MSHWEGDVYTLRDGYHVRQIEWSDPRLPPEMNVWLNQDEYVFGPDLPSRRGGVSHGLVRLEDERGSWDGQLEGVFPYDDRYATEWFTLTGSGAYEGLHAVLVASHWYGTGTSSSKTRSSASSPRVGHLRRGRYHRTKIDHDSWKEHDHEDDGKAHGGGRAGRPGRMAQVVVAQEEESDTRSAYVTGALLDLQHDISNETSD